MKANQKFTRDDEAVSPVIGVILMVAITVVLAAVVFVLVSDLGGDATVSSFPQARLAENPNSDGNITLEHRGGDCIELGNYDFRVDGVVITPGTTNVSSDPSFCVGDKIDLSRAAGWSGTVTVTAIQKDSQAIVYENGITV